MDFDARSQISERSGGKYELWGWCTLARTTRGPNRVQKRPTGTAGEPKNAPCILSAQSSDCPKIFRKPIARSLFAIDHQSDVSFHSIFRDASNDESITTFCIGFSS